MKPNELESKRRDSLNFRVAQHIVALLHEIAVNDIEATLKLVNEIQQSEDERNIAIISYRKNNQLVVYGDKGSW